MTYIVSTNSIAQPVIPVDSAGAVVSPATAANQATEIASLASIDAKTPASPATSGKQDTGNTSLASIDTKLTAPVLGAGTAIIGKVGIDHTTPGTTDAVVANGPVAEGVAASGNPLGMAGIANNVAPSGASAGQAKRLWVGLNGQMVIAPASSSSAGADAVSNSIATFTDPNGAVIRNWTMNYVFNGTTWDRAPGNTVGAFVVAKPATSGGVSTSRIVTGTTGVIKAAPGQVYKVTFLNINAAVRYLHLYDKASAPTLSTDTPIMTIPMPGTGSREVDITALGVPFATGISWAYTTDDIAIPATAATSTELHATVYYK